MEIGVTFFVVAVAVILIWVFIELKRMRHKVFAIFLITLIVFSYISASVVFRGKNVDLTSVSGVIDATKIYFSWLGAVAGNFKTITTNAIKMDWSSTNHSSEK